MQSSRVLIATVRAKFRVYLDVRTCGVCLCFVAIVRVRVYYLDFSGEVQILTQKMDLNLGIVLILSIFTDFTANSFTIYHATKHNTNHCIP